MIDETEILKKRILELEKEMRVLRTNLDVESALRYVAEDKLQQWERYIQECMSKANE